jgi:hypothetical protein
MPSSFPIDFRPSLASWLNERSLSFPMSVTMAILKSPCELFAEPAELMISALIATSATTAPTTDMRAFTCPPYE